VEDALGIEAYSNYLMPEQPLLAPLLQFPVHTAVPERKGQTRFFPPAEQASAAGTFL